MNRVHCWGFFLFIVTLAGVISCNKFLTPNSQATRANASRYVVTQREGEAFPSYMATTNTACQEGIDSFSKSVHPFVRERCTHCHDTGGIGPTFAVADVNDAYARIIRYQNFDDIPDSYFVQKGGSMHCLNDYGYDCKTNTDDVMGAVQAWWDGGEKNCPRKGKFFSIPKVLPTSLPSVNQGFVPLRLTFGSSYPDLAGSVFEVEVQQFTTAQNDSTGSYRFRKPRLAMPSKAVHVKNIKILVNGKFNTLEDDYTNIDVSIGPHAIPKDATTPLPHPVLSALPMVVLQDQAQGDEISISFEAVDILSAGPSCKALSKFQQLVMPSINARNCFACHAGGASQSPGKLPANARLNMTLTDTDMCTAMLERVDAANNTLSPCFTYPLKGANGHPKIFTGSSEATPWLQWMQAELGG